MVISFLISFLASLCGAICGIGGGVIIKPVLDSLQTASVQTVSFLSGCTVLSMSCYSVANGLRKSDREVDFRTGTPLAVGAAAGGIIGKQIFRTIQSTTPNPETAGGVQAVLLAVITVGTLLYTIRKERITPRRTDSILPCIAIGLLLGIMSSFLGIGGGPINLVVLHFFFGMEPKTAASNSLYIILFSQFTSLLTTLLAGAVPPFEMFSLILMIAGGIGGGILGRRINSKISSQTVDRLFIALMIVIIFISVYNSLRCFSS